MYTNRVSILFLLWNQIVPAFNEICGKGFDEVKLKEAFRRIKHNRVTTRAHSLLYDETDDNHVICRVEDRIEDKHSDDDANLNHDSIKTLVEDWVGKNYTQVETDNSLQEEESNGDTACRELIITSPSGGTQDTTDTSLQEEESTGVTNSKEPERSSCGGGKHMSETERMTLVNLIKTLDKEELLRMKVLRVNA